MFLPLAETETFVSPSNPSTTLKLRTTTVPIVLIVVFLSGASIVTIMLPSLSTIDTFTLSDENAESRPSDPFLSRSVFPAAPRRALRADHRYGPSPHG